MHLNTEVNITQAFLDVLLVPLRIKVASAALEKTKMRVAQAIVDLAFDVEETYYTLVAEQKRVRLMEPLINTAEAIRDLSHAQHQHGNISDLELMNQSKLSLQTKISYSKSQAEVILLKSRLNQLLGLCGESWEVIEDLPPLPMEDICDDCLSEWALSNRLDLQELRWELDRIAKLGATKQWWAYTDLAGGFAMENDPDGTFTRGPAIVGAIPIFNYGQADRARLCAQYRQTHNLLSALEIRVLAEVEAARQEQIVQRTLVEQYDKELIPLQSRILSLSEDLYNYMTLSVYALLNEVYAEIEMQIDSTMALRDYWIATTRLDRALGAK